MRNNHQYLISVIIPTRNRLELLDAALSSVAAQNLNDHIEVIVVNDAGVSVTQVIRSWNSILDIKLTELDRRVGPSAARNIGLQSANAKYIAFLDDDDLFLPHHLMTGYKFLETAQTDIVYLGAIVSDRRLSSLPSNAIEFPSKAYQYDYKFLRVANFIHTGSVITRNFKNTLVRFDETLDVCEDWDLWLALTTTLGYRMSFIDQIATIYHQVPEVVGLVASGQFTSPSKFEIARGYIYAKWPSDDPLVLVYREWLIAFERVRSDLIARGWKMPNLLFDNVLSYLHRRITIQEMPNYDDIMQFFSVSDTMPR